VTKEPIPPERPRWSAMAALMAAMFTIAMGYGVVLPILPFSIERLAATRDATVVSWNTGLLTGTYTLALFLFAPLWGRISDRLGRLPLILSGLVGFALTLALFGLIDSLPLLYVSRFLNGVFASAITPAAYALVGDLALSRAERAHRFALLNLAATAGFLVGPMIGGLVLGAARAFVPWLGTAAGGAPFLVTAALVLLAMPFVWYFLPRPPRRQAAIAAAPSSREFRAARARLLIISLVTAAAIGAFEVGLSLRGKAVLGLDAYRIGLMFTECSLVMFVAQGLVFSPLVKPEATRWLLGPGLAILAAGLVAVSLANSYLTLILAVALIAASAGILSPIVTYWISLGADKSQGANLGLQTAAASLGQMLGSVAGGLLFDVPTLPGGSFTVPAALVMGGFAAALGLPGLLARLLNTQSTPPYAATTDSSSRRPASAVAKARSWPS
jgi:MFS family permease